MPCPFSLKAAGERGFMEAKKITKNLSYQPATQKKKKGGRDQQSQQPPHLGVPSMYPALINLATHMSWRMAPLRYEGHLSRAERQLSSQNMSFACKGLGLIQESPLPTLRDRRNS